MTMATILAALIVCGSMVAYATFIIMRKLDKLDDNINDEIERIDALDKGLDATRELCHDLYKNRWDHDKDGETLRYTVRWIEALTGHLGLMRKNIDAHIEFVKKPKTER
jgi:hypothetical protein